MRVHGEKLGTSGRVCDVAGQGFIQYEPAGGLNASEYKVRRCLTYCCVSGSHDSRVELARNASPAAKSCNSKSDSAAAKEAS